MLIIKVKPLIYDFVGFFEQIRVDIDMIFGDQIETVFNFGKFEVFDAEVQIIHDVENADIVEEHLADQELLLIASLLIKIN